MIAAMRRQGHQVRVVAPSLSAGAAFGHDGGLVARIRRRLPGMVSEILEFGYSVLAYRRLRQAYDQFAPDLLYERYNLFFLAGWWLKRRTGIAHALEVNAPLAEERAAHGGLKLRALARWSQRVAWRGADLTLPVTRVLAEDLRRAGVAEARILVVANGIDRRHFPPDLDRAASRAALGLSDRIVLGFIGFVRDWHGLTEVVEAMATPPRRDDLHLLVIGEGPGLAPLQARARELGLSGQLTCLGLMPRERVAACLAAFDIALQPRVVAYASPLKLFEYMALGRAILAPAQPNIAEILTDGEDALLFEPDNPADFRRQILRLCDDEGLRQRLGAAARRTIETRGLTWDANVTRVLSAFPTGGRP